MTDSPLILNDYLPNQASVEIVNCAPWRCWRRHQWGRRHGRRRKLQPDWQPCSGVGCKCGGAGFAHRYFTTHPGTPCFDGFSRPVVFRVLLLEIYKHMLRSPMFCDPACSEALQWTYLLLYLPILPSLLLRYRVPKIQNYCRVLKAYLVSPRLLYIKFSRRISSPSMNWLVRYSLSFSSPNMNSLLFPLCITW